MKFLRPGYWQKILLFLIFLVQFLAVVIAVICLFDYVAYIGYQPLFAFFGIIFFLDVALAVYILNSPSPDIYRLSWLFLVFAIPVGGALLYIIFANKQTSKHNRRKLERLREGIEDLPTLPEVKQKLDGVNHYAVGMSEYLQKSTGGGIHDHTSVQFFPLVDDAFEPILEELRKAKHFIFLEFFIVAPGKMWDSMLEILKEKAAAGLDVRFIYDDVGSLTTAPIHYAEELTAMGIKTVRYYPFRPALDIRMNNRDHRKILVIDGHTCFSGGFNLADEYINAEVRFGHWKDNAILLRGKAVANFTNMFLANWVSQTRDIKEFESLKSERHSLYDPSVYIDEIGGYPESDGFVQPYGDFPFDGEAVGERVYIDLINRSTKTLYMTTPYLVIDKELENALLHACARGVDVRLLTPHIPDKKAVFNLTRSFYGNLIKAGVKVYEYTPGFVHEKTFICDGEMATVGTINLDYRSLFLHLECGTFMVGCSCIADMEKDFLETIEKSWLITKEQYDYWRGRQYWYWAILRLLGPFL